MRLRTAFLLALAGFGLNAHAAPVVVQRGQKYTITKSGGQYTYTGSPGDQNYLDDTGNWSPVDETLTTDGVGGYAVQMTKARHRVRVAPGGNYEWFPDRRVSTEFIDVGTPQFWTGSAWSNLTLGVPTVSGNVYTFDQTNYRVTLICTWRSVETIILLKNSSAPTQFRVSYSLTGLTLSGNQLTSQSTGKGVGSLPQPVAWDANNAPVSMTQDTTGGFITWTAATAGATFPVTIDPTFSSTPNADVGGSDTELASAQATTNLGSQATMRIGDESGNGTVADRGCLKFDLSSIPKGSRVSAASVSLIVSPGAGSATPMAHELHLLLKNWVYSQATYNIYSTGNNWATVGATGATDSSATVSAFVNLSANGGSNGITTWSGSQLTTDVQSFINSPSTNFGWLIRCPTCEFGAGGALEYIDLGSSNNATAGNRPSISVTYSPPTGGDDFQNEWDNRWTNGWINGWFQ